MVSREPVSGNKKEDNHDNESKTESYSKEAANVTVGVALAGRGDNDGLNKRCLLIGRHFDSIFVVSCASAAPSFRR